MPQSAQPYQKEVDGLRAFAVIAVIVFHAMPNFAQSGFTGVDTFLVISGYLITNIIKNAIEAGRFSLNDFYKRRIKRIIPLTYATLILVMILWFFYSYPDYYRAESISSISALFFIANFRFALMGDYFITGAHNPLLHLWSLSLEEQFYLFWPIGLLLLYKLRFSQKGRLGMVLLLLCITLSLSIWASAAEPYRTFSYYLLPTRMFSLLVGVFLSLLEVKKTQRSVITVIGFVLLAYSTFCLSKQTYPGYEVIFPCIASALLIYSNESKLSQIILGNRVTVFIGQISFSLYMLHVPILVYAVRYFEKTPVFLWCYLMTVFISSALSYKLVEGRFRYAPVRNPYLSLLLCPLILLLGINLWIAKTNGLPSRYGLTKKMTLIDSVGCFNSIRDNLCYISTKNQGEPEALFIGDSHAGALSNFMQVLSDELNISLIDATSSDCLFYSDEYRSVQCEIAKKKIKSRLPLVKNIFIASRVDGISKENLKKLSAFMNELVRDGYKVIYIQQVPMLAGNIDNKQMILRYIDKDLQKQTQQMNFSFKNYNEQIRGRLNKKILVLNLNHLFQSKQSYRVLDEQGYPLYFDYNHLNAYGAEWLARQYIQSGECGVVKRFLNKD